MDKFPQKKNLLVINLPFVTSDRFFVSKGWTVFLHSPVARHTGNKIWTRIWESEVKKAPVPSFPRREVRKPILVNRCSRVRVPTPAPSSVEKPANSPHQQSNTHQKRDPHLMTLTPFRVFPSSPKSSRMFHGIFRGQNQSQGRKEGTISILIKGNFTR